MSAVIHWRVKFNVRGQSFKDSVRAFLWYFWAFHKIHWAYALSHRHFFLRVGFLEKWPVFSIAKTFICFNKHNTKLSKDYRRIAGGCGHTGHQKKYTCILLCEVIIFCDMSYLSSTTHELWARCPTPIEKYQSMFSTPAKNYRWHLWLWSLLKTSLKIIRKT